MRYEIPFEDIKEAISDPNIEKVAIQLPEGLKRYGKEIIKNLKEDIGKEIILAGYPCYGACDTKDDQLKRIGVDKIIHLGHFNIPFKKSIETQYFPIKSRLEVKKILKKSLEKISGNEIGLITTPQYSHKIKEIKDFLEKNSIKTKVADGSNRIASEGLVLGCDFSASRVDADEVLYVGSGKFHPLGVALANKTNVLSINPESGEVKEIGYEKIIKKRFSIIGKVRNLDYFGVLISTKKGQLRYGLAKEIKELIESSSKKADLIAMDDILDRELINVDYDAYINTGCPRLSIDDYNKFEHPIITPYEAKIAFGEKEYKDYQMDEF